MSHNYFSIIVIFRRLLQIRKRVIRHLGNVHLGTTNEESRLFGAFPRLLIGGTQMSSTEMAYNRKNYIHETFYSL